MRLTLFCQQAARFPKVMVIAANIANATYHSIRRATKAMRKTLNAAANPIFFEPAASRLETRGGEPSYVSGAHIWKGTKAILKPKPAITKINAIKVAGEKFVIATLAMPS